MGDPILQQAIESFESALTMYDKISQLSGRVIPDTLENRELFKRLEALINELAEESMRVPVSIVVFSPQTD